MSSNTPNYYEILNAQTNATYDELKQNYKKLILQHHPDKIKLQEQELEHAEKLTSFLDNNHIILHEATSMSDKKFVTINKAWSTLKDPNKRKLYDAELLLTKFQLHSNVFAQITLADMELCTEEITNNEESVAADIGSEATNMISTEFYTYNCRCGGQYIVDESAANEILSNVNNDSNCGPSGSSSSHNNVVDKQTDEDSKVCDKNKDNAANHISNSSGIFKDVAEEVLVECNECSLVIVLKPQINK